MAGSRSSHSHAFDKAIDAALQAKEPPSESPDQHQVDPETHDVTLLVTLRWNPNPGWEVDTYIANVGKLGELARARLVHRLEAAELGDGDVGDDPAQAEHGEDATAREDSEQ